MAINIHYFRATLKTTPSYAIRRMVSAGSKPAADKIPKVHIQNKSTMTNTGTVLPPTTAAHFKSQIGFFKVILPPNTAVSEYRRFFASPMNSGIGRDDRITSFFVS